MRKETFFWLMAVDEKRYVDAVRNSPRKRGRRKRNEQPHVVEKYCL